MRGQQRKGVQEKKQEFFLREKRERTRSIIWSEDTLENPKRGNENAGREDGGKRGKEKKINKRGATEIRWMGMRQKTSKKTRRADQTGSRSLKKRGKKKQERLDAGKRRDSGKRACIPRRKRRAKDLVSCSGASWTKRESRVLIAFF